MDNKDKTNTEAPVVAFTNVKSPKGFNWSYTMRGNDGKEIIPMMVTFETWCLDNGWTPNEQRMGGGFTKKEKEYAVGKDGNKIQCPTCKTGYLLKKISKTTNKEFRPCENGGYNALTKQKTGCEYIDWMNPPKPTTPMTVEEYENYADNYKG
ncbi:hypothetical protein M0R04_10420 [Candidatus Dojkabacteria bacterium]|jgi:hypothetical protein|nr:hypothetical protein [Candidatus Dojkabacteria bacterium]